MHDEVTAAEHSRTQSRRAAASGWIGSTLEYYDFAIYGTAAALIFPQIFFPEGDPAIAVIASLATYGVGYVARPLGAFILGNLGDRHGRKNVLVMAMLLMGVSTFVVGLLPTYGQVGLLAPLLLVVLRLIQGFAVAGELSGASAMIVEHAPDNKRGFYASFSLQGTQVGSILGTAAFIPLSTLLSDEAFQAWGWRVPFLLSAVVIAAAMIIRMKVRESEVFIEQAKKQPEQTSVWRVFRENGGTVVRAVCMGLANVIGTTVVIFGTAYATQESYGIGMSEETYLWMPVVANIVAIILIPFFGQLSDRIGRRPLMIFGPLSAGVLTFPYLWAVSERNVVLTVILAVLMFGILYQMWNATFASFFQEMFPTRNRMAGFALSQNIALFLVAMLPSLFAFIAPPGSDSVPLVIGGITLGISVISAVAAWLSKETFQATTRSLDGDPAPQDQSRAQNHAQAQRR